MKARAPLPAVVATFLLSLTGCASIDGTLQGLNPEAPREGSTRTNYLAGSVDAVWFEMRQVLARMNIPVTDEDLGTGRASLNSRSFAASPDDFHCGARPTGEEPLARTVQASLAVTLEEVSPSRTEVRLYVTGIAHTVDPAFRGREESCYSRGALEQRIVQQTQQRLRAYGGE